MLPKLFVSTADPQVLVGPSPRPQPLSGHGLGLQPTLLQRNIFAWVLIQTSGCRSGAAASSCDDDQRSFKYSNV